MDYVDELLKGKAVRVTYKRFIEDFMGDGSGWNEELWTYDDTLKMCKLFYPVSSYEKGFFTYHSLSEAELDLRNIDRDEDVKSVAVENNIDNSIESKELKDVAKEIFNNLNEERLRLFIASFQE